MSRMKNQSVNAARSMTRKLIRLKMTSAARDQIGQHADEPCHFCYAVSKQGSTTTFAPSVEFRCLGYGASCNGCSSTDDTGVAKTEWLQMTMRPASGSPLLASGSIPRRCCVAGVPSTSRICNPPLPGAR
ncbi:hypothetical protein L1887_59307 [Cichorium endivia]|nr:hypothetical protein L1887_59307 [Cichorium endivia]